MFRALYYLYSPYYSIGVSTYSARYFLRTAEEHGYDPISRPIANMITKQGVVELLEACIWRDGICLLSIYTVWTSYFHTLLEARYKFGIPDAGY